MNDKLQELVEGRSGVITKVWGFADPKDVDRMLGLFDLYRSNRRPYWYVRAWLWVHGWRYQDVP